MLGCVIGKSWADYCPKGKVFLATLLTAVSFAALGWENRYSEENRAEDPFAKGRPLNLELVPVGELLRGWSWKTITYSFLLSCRKYLFANPLLVPDGKTLPFQHPVPQGRKTQLWLGKE